jgi:hypothetical protein
MTTEGFPISVPDRLPSLQCAPSECGRLSTPQPVVRVLFSGGDGHLGALILCAIALPGLEQGPDHARHFGGERHNDDLDRTSGHEIAQPGISRATDTNPVQP